MRKAGGRGKKGKGCLPLPSSPLALSACLQHPAFKSMLPV